MKKRSVTNLHILGGDGNILSMQLDEIIKYFERPRVSIHIPLIQITLISLYSIQP